MEIRLARGISARMGQRELLLIRSAMGVLIQVIAVKPERPMVFARVLEPYFPPPGEHTWGLEVMLLAGDIEREVDLACQLLGFEALYPADRVEVAE